MTIVDNFWNSVDPTWVLLGSIALLIIAIYLVLFPTEVLVEENG